jgi:hypothetical protein
MYCAEGGDMNAEFGEVVSCSTHIQFAGVATHLPADPPEQDDDMVNLMSFSDCTLLNQSNAIEALAAHRQWGDYLAENGSDNFSGAIFPIAGEDPDADYNYKSVTAYSSAAAYGNAIATVVPGGLQRAGQIFGRVTQCDTQRVYTSVPVRTAEGED